MAKRKAQPQTKLSRRGCRNALLVLVGVCGLTWAVSLSGPRRVSENDNSSNGATNDALAGEAIRSQADGATQVVAEATAFKGTVTPSATITDTPSPTVTQTAAPTTSVEIRREIAVTSMPNVPLYYVMRDANARRCPETDCEVIVIMQAGEYFGAHGLAFGDEVSGSTQWYQTKVGLDREIAYVHSSLVINAELVAQPQQVQSQVQQPPVSQPVVPAQNWNCNGDIYNCGSFGSRAEMDAYWLACPGDPSDLDGNEDGEYCTN